MATIPVVGAGQVKGDITSCRIETKMIKLEKNGIFSLTEKQHFISYDVCTKNVVESYSVPQLAGAGVLGMCFIAVLALASLIAWSSTGRNSNDW